MLRSCCLLLLVCSLAGAQALNGTLVGTVTDPSGAVVPNTNESGNYIFSNLPQGRYTVSIEHASFRKATREAVEVTIISEQVTITAEVPALQTDRTDTGRKMTSARWPSCR